ncbi:MAG: HlyD family secretion protein [Caldilineaceae bacterium]
MKRIAQWSLLYLMIAVAGFGVTLLGARGAQMARMLGDTPELTALEPPMVTAAESLPQERGTVATLGLSPSESPSIDALQAEPVAAEPALEAAPADQQLPSGEELSAVGAIEVKEDRQVVLGTGGRVDHVLVEEGDRVSAGELLVALDTTYLDWAVEQAEIGFETARINFEELGDEIEESDIELARAQLLQAQEDYAEVEAGPKEEELAAAQSAATAAWAQYQEVQDKPTPAQVNSALATMRKAEISVQQAQREFDKIAWLPESAATDAADNLQKATVDLEAAKAAYEEASKPATEAELNSALSAAQSAQDKLNRLLEMPTPAKLASANANVLSAQTALDKLEEGPKESELRKSELSVRQAMIGLEQARLAREHAEVTAPIDGVVLAVNLDVGQEASAGTVAAILADTENLRLIVNVEQKDIGRIETGQPVVISVFALPQEQFLGQVDRIAPTANSGTGFVTFPVVIVLTDGPLDQLLPGMTASAVFAEGEPAAAASESEAQAEETVSETASGENASDSATSNATDAEVDAESSSTGAGEADDTGDSAP